MRSDTPADVYLLPGDIRFADANTRIHTVLGSCISIALWHPLLRSGGMCHFMLPSRGYLGSDNLDGRYADEAFRLILREIETKHTHPGAYQVKLFGGGNMFQATCAGTGMDVARDNIKAARALLDEGGFHVAAEDVGGNGHRRIIFDLRDGNVWVRHDRVCFAVGAD